jgi:hypothetical protein
MGVTERDEGAACAISEGLDVFVWVVVDRDIFRHVLRSQGAAEKQPKEKSHTETDPA